MKVILYEDVKSVGKKEQIVDVSDAYARNCIIKKNLGVEATQANLHALKLKKANEDREAAAKLAQAKELAKELETKTITLSIKEGEGGRTFGSISTKEIVAAAKQQLGYEFDKKKIDLKNPIKSPGEFTIEIKLHPEVTGSFKLIVKGQ